ncbi:MAG TPA: thioredoxin-disulfide reductase [Acidobacteriota bacterium]|nr:thioredoxin-disulfide reductase [Acidobacteriota bacterium]
MAEEKQYEVVIVGGGPGGLCAGLYCSRARRKTICLEKYLPGGQIAITGEVEDYLGFEQIAGADLAMKFSEHAKKFGLEIAMEEVVELYLDGDERVARCASGNVYRGKAAIVSTGGSPVKLGVPGEEEYSGKGVSYCAICDGAFFRDQVIAVVGGGDAAVEEGTFLTKFASKVIIIHRRDQLRAQKIIQQRAFDNPGVQLIWDTIVESVNGDGKRVTHLSLRNVKTQETSRLEVGAVFPYLGFRPNSNIIRGDLRKDSGGYILTNDRMETSIRGIFACGDVRAQLVRQVTNAVGDGTTAAVAAEKYIEDLEDKHRSRA